jgi:cytochrome P450
MLIIHWVYAAYGVAARYPIFHVLLGGEGIFTQDGVSWKNSRNAISSLFKGIRADIVPRLEELTEGLLQRIPTEQFIDLQPMFFRFTFSTTIDLLFGKSIELPGSSAPIEGFLETEARFSEAFRKAQNFVVRRGRLGPFYFMDIWSQKHCSTVHQFIDAAIEKVLSGEYQKRSGDHSLLEHLIEKGIKNPRVLRDQLVNVMLAGRDTTACLLTWTL